MKRILVLVAAVLTWAVASEDRVVAQSGVRWQGSYKGSGTKFNSTGRGTPVTTPGYSSYRYNTPKPIPFRTIPSADPGRYRSSPSNSAPSIGIHRGKIQDHR